MTFVRPTAHTGAKISKGPILALILALVTLGAFTLAVPASLYAGQATLSWNPSTSTGTIGYKVHFGTSSGQYAQSIDVGNVTSYTVTSLTDGEAYYFAATSYGSSGVQSGYSNEVSKTLSSGGTCTITATAGSNGTIAALGNANVTSAASGTTTTVSATVTSGASQSFSITPNTGYRVANVTVDGASVGAVTSYTFSNVTANHTLSATFAAIAVNSYSIAASAGAGGSITPSGTTTVASGGSQSYTITPATGYYTASVTVDGTVVASNLGGYTYSFSGVAANHTISATFATSTFNLTASAATGGTVSPAGTTVASYGTSKTYTITPAAGYAIASVSVDGTSVGAVPSYTFSGIAANHTISATFAASSYYLTASAGTGGAISPAGTTVASYGTSKTYTITPAAGYAIASVSVDDTSVGAVSSYTFSSIAANHTISASFSPASTGYSITASAGTGGGISPSGTSSVPPGGSKTYIIAPSTGYYTASVSVDGKVVATNQGNYSYTFNNVSGNHTISATFAVSTFNLVASAGNNGTISPKGTSNMKYGTSTTYTITPNPGRRIARVLVDGVSVGAVSSYTFSRIAANHTISATFW